jgi:hypothetical protein
MHDALPYLAGIGCSLCYGIATSLEQFAARRHSTIRSLNPAHFLKLLQQSPYIIGIVLDLVGWGLFLYAARVLPLFLDLSFVAASLMVTAIISQVHDPVKSIAKEGWAIVLVMAGILLLGFIAQPSSAHTVNHHFVQILEVFPVVLAVIGAGWLRSASTRPAAVALATCSGLAFGATGIISRVITTSHLDFHTIVQPLIVSLIAYGALGMIFLSAAFQKDTINRVNTTLYSSELTIPSLLGILFLGDHARHGLWLLVIAGFLLVIIGTVTIAQDSTT